MHFATNEFIEHTNCVTGMPRFGKDVPSKTQSIHLLTRRLAGRRIPAYDSKRLPPDRQLIRLGLFRKLSTRI